MSAANQPYSEAQKAMIKKFNAHIREDSSSFAAPSCSARAIEGETHEIPERECSICKGNGFIDVEKHDRVEQEDCRWCGTTGIEPNKCSNA